MSSRTITHGSDICQCGDFRSEHEPGCFCGCHRFRFSYEASEYNRAIWYTYHDPESRAKMQATEATGHATTESSTEPQGQTHEAPQAVETGPEAGVGENRVPET